MTMSHAEAEALIDRATTITEAGEARWSWIGGAGQPLYQTPTSDGADFQVLKENGTFRLWRTDLPDAVEIRDLVGDPLQDLRPKLAALFNSARGQAE